MLPLPAASGKVPSEVLPGEDLLAVAQGAASPGHPHARGIFGDVDQAVALPGALGAARAQIGPGRPLAVVELGHGGSLPRVTVTHAILFPDENAARRFVLRLHIELRGIVGTMRDGCLVHVIDTNDQEDRIRALARESGSLPQASR